MRGLIVTLCFALLAAIPARAHESRPLYVEVIEEDADAYAVRWRTPPSVPLFNAPTVSVAAPCELLGPERKSMGVGGPVVEARYRCSGGLGGSTVEIAYPKFNPSVSTLIRLTWADGETRTILAGPKETLVVIPAPETTAGVARQYTSLGITHIITGYDHLLFLACLIFIAGAGRRIVYTVTGFTLAHSVTLALAALGAIHVPAPPVEAAIALSIVFVATEIARNRRATLTWRYPITVSSSFGLLHGLGFASVLGEIGLPQTEIVPALLFFNLGIEAGQLVFVGIVLLMGYALRAVLSGRRPEGAGGSRSMVSARLQIPTAYVVGALASFWMIERIGGFLP